MRTVGLVVAILLGIAAAIGVKSYMDRREREFQEEHEMVEVAVAKRSILAGETLTDDMVGFKEKPANSLTSEDIVTLEVPRFLDQKVTGNIDRGSPILVRHFVAPRAKAASGVLTEGKRAITIAVDSTSSVAGLIRPRDRVDIYATTAASARSAEPETWLVLSDVTVLALDDRMSERPVGYRDYRGYRRGYSSLTLAVTPMEAQVLVYLKDYGRLTFSLRPRVELGQKGLAPTVTAANVRELATQANKQRQRELQELGEPGTSP